MVMAIINTVRHTALPVKILMVLRRPAPLVPNCAIKAVCRVRIDMRAPAKLRALDADRMGRSSLLYVIRLITAVVT